MSTRRKGYGTRSSPTAREFGGAINATKAHLKRQPAGAEFTTAPAVKQWRCACGVLNLARHQSCRSCGGGRT